MRKNKDSGIASLPLMLVLMLTAIAFIFVASEFTYINAMYAQLRHSGEAAAMAGALQAEAQPVIRETITASKIQRDIIGINIFIDPTRAELAGREALLESLKRKPGWVITDDPQKALRDPNVRVAIDSNTLSIIPVKSKITDVLKTTNFSVPTSGRANVATTNVKFEAYIKPLFMGGVLKFTNKSVNLNMPEAYRVKVEVSGQAKLNITKK
ncbi:MAG: hypothetical protein KM296_00135 [Brockia lithotrophica]|nr:hypothetical protein [Brockia lithotrophica]